MCRIRLLSICFGVESGQSAGGILAGEALLMRYLLARVLAVSCLFPSGALPQAPLPPFAKLVTQMDVDFRGGAADRVLLYTVPDATDEVYQLWLVRVLRSGGGTWKIAYENTSRMKAGSDKLTLRKLRSRAGKEGVLAISSYSGAGTATAWQVVASAGNKLVALDSGRLRTGLLKTRGLIDNGYNSVSEDGDLIVEKMPGYSRRAPRCCPDKPGVEMRFRFTGTSIEPAGISSGSLQPPAGRTPSGRTGR
jgi:hypothetical protein